jgi:hypothetical protein
MPDITMCTNGECSLKDSCYRFRAIPSPFQSYSHFEGDKDCQHYWLVVGTDKVREYPNPWSEEFENNKVF